LEQLYEEGKARAIGVSNYTKQHLEAMRQNAKVLPMVLQSECHPLLLTEPERDFCAKEHIAFQAYTSLGQGQFFLNYTGESQVPLDMKKELDVMAKKYGKHVSQVLLRWALQQRLHVIPKSATAKYVESNAQVFDFELSDQVPYIIL
jgi:diketogulonate reductase-like aldo/keto reductase